MTRQTGLQDRTCHPGPLARSFIRSVARGVTRGVTRGVNRPLARTAAPGPILPVLMIVLIALGACSTKGEQTAENAPPVPGSEPAGAAKPVQVPTPRQPTLQSPGGTAPFVTGGSGARIPEGHATEITLGGTTISIPYTQIGAMVSSAGNSSLLLRAEPGKDAKRIGPHRYPALSVAWNAPTAEVNSLAALAGRTFVLDKVPIGRAVLRIEGKEYMATRMEIRIEESTSEVVRGTFTATFGEFDPRKSMEPMGEVTGQGTFRAYPGKWLALSEKM